MTRSASSSARSIGLLGLVGVALLTLVLGCSSPRAGDGGEDTEDRPTAEVTAQPQDPQVAEVIAEQVFGLLAGGDAAGAWELWTKSAKDVVAKDAYVNLISNCPQQVGVQVEITGSRAIDSSTVSVSWKRQEATGSSTMRYEEGAWRFEPAAEALQAYQRGACG